jgi:hypothetical protein
MVCLEGKSKNTGKLAEVEERNSGASEDPV